MNRRASLPLALTLILAFTFFAACAGGGGTSGGAGTSGGTGPGTGTAGATGSGGAGTGTAGAGASSGTAGAAGGGVAGSGPVGTGGTAGTPGTGGSAGITGSSGSAGTGTAGTTGGAAGTTGGGGAAAGSGGGAAGRGGATGAGGSAAGTTGGGGASAGATGSGGSGGGPAPSSIIIQDNFDGTASGGPAAAQWSAYPQGQTNIAPVVDASRHHSGANAAMATSTSSGLGSFLVPASGTLAGTAVTGNAFYVRVWINWQKATTAISGHSGFLVGSSARDESGTELRLGISSKGPGSTPRMDLNLQNPMDGAGGEVTRYSNGFTDGGNPASFTGTGYQFAASTWTCVEAFFNGATAGSEFRVWINDQELTEMHVTDFSANNAGRTHWAPSFKYIKIGANDYDANLGQIWYDDVVVATQKIGCSYVVP